VTRSANQGKPLCVKTCGEMLAAHQQPALRRFEEVDPAKGLSTVSFSSSGAVEPAHFGAVRGSDGGLQFVGIDIGAERHWVAMVG
jgi:hypothetical protein